jgi:hypothetical protein
LDGEDEVGEFIFHEAHLEGFSFCLLAPCFIFWRLLLKSSAGGNPLWLLVLAGVWHRVLGFRGDLASD